MQTLISLSSFIASLFFLGLNSYFAERIQATRSSPAWILLIWLVSIAATVIFTKLYSASLIIYILFFLVTSFLCYLGIGKLHMTPAMLFSFSNIAILLIVFYNMGIIGNNKNIPLLTDIQITADSICACHGNEECLMNITPHMQQLIFESRHFQKEDASLSLPSITRASQCILPTRKKTQITTLLDEWEKDLQAKTHSPISTPFQILASWWKKSRSNLIQQQNPALQNKKEQNQEKPEKTEMQAETEKPKLPEFKLINTAATKKYIGDIVKLTKKNGTVLEGWLLEDTDNQLIIKKKHSSGYALLPISKKAIHQIETKKRLTIKDRIAINSSYTNNLVYDIEAVTQPASKTQATSQYQKQETHEKPDQSQNRQSPQAGRKIYEAYQRRIKELNRSRQ
jgi:hypothetical protein